ncbi:gas vesicle protein GvpA [Natrialba chahannaoensis JCM 10990]|uniref:Gas vesicle protein GvpA n=1 Tax=Natrialba chahannaoensis JCM 10990 TaxID=1227492 RepID=M0AJM2_9EURY|nr:gas vesicle protein [Natrialba chahannaoensis]ELY97593.1 gas vesicle protein GvpA [Natrialba chahannaoensis JCM 10990]
MADSFQPSRQQSDLADIVEMLLDKGIVINADIAVSIGDTQLLGIQLRAAIASFETAAKYGLEFPEGTDMQRVAEAAGDPELAEMERPKPAIDPTRGVNVTAADDGDEDSGDDDDNETGGNDGDDADTEAATAQDDTDETADDPGGNE